MNLKQFWGIVLALLVVLSMGSSRLAAQTATTGDIAGVVTDPSNAVVPDAKVSIKSNTKGTTQETKTNKDGGYHFYLLSPDPYTITVTAPGFEITTRQTNVALGQIGTVDVQLTLGASTQTVTVTESAPLIQTENGDTSTAVDAQQVANIPNPGNDLTAIAQLAPGVVSSPVAGAGGNLEAFGLPGISNLFTLNGMDDNDAFLNVGQSGSSNQLLGTNEVQEADVVTNGYSSSYGTLAGINVNYITKSGGNDFHGNAVYYWNGRAMNANDWFNNDNGLPRSFDNANQWAASIGGPIKKDKLFFFLNTEGLRVLIPVPSTIFVPTTAFETAVVNNLTALGDTASIPYYCQNLAGICPGVTAQNAKDGAGIFNLFNSAKNQANAQNNLPPGKFLGNGCSNVPNVGAFAGFTGPCAESIREVPINFAPEKQIAGRTDWNVGPNDRAYLRMAYDEGTQPTETDPINPIFNASSIQPQYQGQLNETHIFGPTLTNQFLVASIYYSAVFQESNPSAALAAFPTTLALGDNSLGAPAACGVGLACNDFIWPQGRNVTAFQLEDDVSKTIGNHTLKFGAKYHKNYVSDHDFGLFNIGVEVPFSLASFANGGDPKGTGGTGTLLEQSFPVSPEQPIRIYEVAGYIQDEWKIKPNLTITPALRLEHESNPTCVTDCFAQLGVPFENIGTVQPYNQLIQINRREALLGYQNLQWEPRISFAWQPFGAATGRWKSDFVIRGGAGIFYDIFPGSISDSLAQNAPLFDTFAIGSGAACPGFLSPNQTPGSNLFSCTSAAQAAFLTAFNSGASVTGTNPNITFTQPKTEAPQFQKWSLEIQKGFGPNDSINVGYYGNHGVHLPVFDNSLNAFGFGSLPGAPASTQFGQVTGVLSEGISNYNGLVASYRHRFSGWAGSGVLQLNYTYSHAFDDISNEGFAAFTSRSLLNPQNPFNLGNMYGPSDYDVRHQLNGNYVWQLPIRRALMGHGWAPLVDGWQVSGAIFYRSGLPFTVTDGQESVGLNGNNYFATIIPNIINAVPTNCSSESIAGATAKTTCFGPATTAPFNFGNGAGGATSESEFGIQGLRNKFRGPGYFDTDFSVMKNTKIPGWERGSLGIGLQFFNLLNHPNFNLPIGDISNGQFGTIQSAVSPPTSILGSFLGGDASPRLIQVKAQLTF
jgi:hypothetical protein